MGVSIPLVREKLSLLLLSDCKSFKYTTINHLNHFGKDFDISEYGFNTYQWKKQRSQQFFYYIYFILNKKTFFFSTL